jgi:hypothetical protein
LRFNHKFFILQGIRDLPDNEETTESPENSSEVTNPADANSSRTKNEKKPDEFEPIEVEGQDETKIWVHRPGLSVSPTFETRKGRVRRAESIIISRDGTDSQCSDTSTVDGDDGKPCEKTEIDSEEKPNVGIDSSSGDKDKEETDQKGKKGFMSMFSRKGSLKIKEVQIQENEDLDELVGDPRVVTSSPVHVSSTAEADKQ